jgi:hypothetical protein
MSDNKAMSEREAFEAWFRKEKGWFELPLSLDTCEWDAWQARASLDASADQAESVGESVHDGELGTYFWELRKHAADFPDGTKLYAHAAPTPAAAQDERGAQNINRPAENPGGCECKNCGRIFIGEEWHTECGVCAAPAPVVTRDFLGQLVRDAWISWAVQQPNRKPSWLVPYAELSEADKEADRMIGERVAKWVIAIKGADWSSFVANPQARASSPAQPVQDERGAFEAALRETYGMVDPLNPPPAGTYHRGEHNGIIAALKTIRENFDRAKGLPDLSNAIPTDFCAFGRTQAYAFKDPSSGEHDPWFVVLPNGAALRLGYHADDATDKAHAEFIAAAINRAMQARAAASPGVGAAARDVLTKALARYDELMASLRGCTDGGCVIRKPKGMHTNGGCRCHRAQLKAQVAMGAAQDLRKALAEIERLDRAGEK